MSNPETTSDPARVPVRTCIRLEPESPARTSLIDAEWETLAAASTRVSACTLAPARPRLQTLPGLGRVSLPPAASTRAARRLPVHFSLLAAALMLSAALVAFLVWRDFGVFARLAMSAPSNLVAVSSEPSDSPTSESARLQPPTQPLPVALVLTSEAPVATSEAELQATKRVLESKATKRSPVPAARATSNRPARLRALAPTDNPY